MRSFLFLLAAFNASLSSVSGSISLQLDPYRRYIPSSQSLLRQDPAPLSRLPTALRPLHYVLHIKPRLFLDESNPESLRVPGNVLITLECLESTNTIILHADDMDISTHLIRVELEADPSESLILTGVRRDVVEQTLVIELEQVLEVGKTYLVYIEFKSRIAPASERMNGLYLSTYQEEGETKLIATTQFSRTRSVRKVFPSFDEPSQKATFEINIGRSTAYHSLSCMNQENKGEEDPIDGEEDWVWDRYSITPVMPITVIAFIVSQFGNYTAPLEMYNPEKPVSTWVPPEMLRNEGAVFSAESAAKTLKFYESLFGIPYELPKLDSAGMPDFAAGAMENWGLNIYRATYMLYYKDETPMTSKYSSSSVIAHELAHQWWGNLVTHAWWNDWWITEGFASYFEHVGSLEVSPEFEQENRIVSDDIQPAMAFDIGPESVPIHGKDTEAFVEIPSAINYSKGASLIHMINAFLRPQLFIQALQHYLNKRAYTAVDQYALFDDIDEFLELNNQVPPNGKSVREIMDSWTLQTGFPLIRISRRSSNQVYVTQELFEAYQGETGEGDGLFHVPLSFLTASHPATEDTERLWMDRSTLLKSVQVGNTDEWVLFNSDLGYYRVLYDDHFEGLLKAQLNENHEVISVASRSQILDDHFAAAFERYIPIEKALDLTSFLTKELDYVVWSTVFRQLRKFSNLIGSSATENKEPFQMYLRKSMQGVIAHLTFVQVPDESPMRTILRALVNDWACSLEDANCLSRAKQLVDEWRPNPTQNPVAVDLRAGTYCAAVASEDEVIWSFMNEQYDDTKSVEVRNALACTSSSEKLNNLLNLAITDEAIIPKSDAVGLIQRIAMNHVGRPLVVKLLDEKTSDIVQYLGSSDSISSIVLTLRDYVASTQERDQIGALVEKYQDSFSEAVKTLLDQYLRTMDANVEWFSYFEPKMSAWFKEQAKKA